MRKSLQDDLMRFEGRFSSRLAMAFAPLVESNDLNIRIRAAQDQLKFMSSALDIAVGPSPEESLLDMVTLVTLGRDAMTSRWSVAKCGKAAQGIVDAFQASFEDIDAIAREAISADVEKRLLELIGEWQRENPNQTEVTSVRLSAVAEARDAAGSNLRKGASGLFSTVRGAAKTADTAVYLGERALHAAQRLPFLVRGHARIAGNELFADTLRNVDKVALPRVSESARPLRKQVDDWVSSLLMKVFVTCGGIAVVSAASWLVARQVHHRLTTRSRLFS